jgi:hypothetical protein
MIMEQFTAHGQHDEVVLAAMQNVITIRAFTGG